jgi:AcrR family transcriptional regulator
MERVTSAAGVTEAVFQEHFADIDDCFLQAGEEMIGRLELAMLRSVYSDAPWPERVRRALRTLLWTITEHPDHARVTMIELPQSGERAAERLRETEAVFASVVEEGRAYAESVSHLSEMSSVGIVGGVFGIIHRRVLEGRTSELPELLADILHFVLLPYLGHERAMIAADAAR